MITGWDPVWEDIRHNGAFASSCTRDGREIWIVLAAQEELGLSMTEADYLFNTERTLDEIRSFVNQLLESED